MCNPCSKTKARPETPLAGWGRLVVAVMGAATLVWPAWAGLVLTPEEQVGRQIYRTGKSPSGVTIQAKQGEGGAEFPASLMTCASCHGQDGRGRPEGGVEPSNITWQELTKPYGLTHAGGRKHGPYDEKSVVLAVALGVDPAGNELSTVMPRYQLAREDAQALLAYLKRLADDRDPGIEESQLTLGTLLPADPAQARWVEGQLTRTFEQWNGRGGLFGRRLRLVALPAPVNAATVAAFLDREQPFALVAPHLSGVEVEVAAVLEERQVPAVGAIAAEPALGFPLARNVFYLFTGVSGQLEVLARWAARESKGPWAVLFPETPSELTTVARLEEQLASLELVAPKRISFPDGAFDAEVAFARVVAESAGAVLLFGGSQEAEALLTVATRRQARFTLMAPAAWAAAGFVGRAHTFGGRLVLAYPALPSDARPAGLAELATLIPPEEDKAAAAKSHSLAVLAASKLLYEALTRAGRDLSRESVVRTLEGLYKFDTVLARPFSYGPNRRVGSWGSYLVEIAPATGEPVGGSWFDLE